MSFQPDAASVSHNARAQVNFNGANSKGTGVFELDEVLHEELLDFQLFAFDNG